MSASSRRKGQSSNPRNSILERIRDARTKGQRFQPEMKSELNVYDMVNDSEYNKIVKARKSLPRVVDEADEIVEDDDCELFDDGEVEYEDGTSKSGAVDSSDGEDSNSTSNLKEVAQRKKDLRDMLVPSSSKGAHVPAKRLRLEEPVVKSGTPGGRDTEPSGLTTLLSSVASSSCASQLPTASAELSDCSDVAWLKDYCIKGEPSNQTKKTQPQGTSDSVRSGNVSEKVDSVAPEPNSVANSLPSSSDSATTSIMSSTSSATSTSTSTISKPAKKLLTAEEEAELVMAQMALKEAERADRLRKREAEAAAERAKQQNAADAVDISDSVLLEAADEMLSSQNNDDWLNKDFETEFTLQADPNTDTSTPKDEIYSTSAVSTPTEAEKQNCLRMYWLDAYEDPFYNPGVVFIFGKTLAPATTSDTTSTASAASASAPSSSTSTSSSNSGYQSCCVVVKNIERRVFFVPRATRRGTALPVTIADVYEEVESKVAPQFRIQRFKSRTVTKRFTFQFEFPDVPWEGDYLEARYSASSPPLPSDLTGDTFCRVLGASTSILELFLLDTKLKGPSWLEVANTEPVPDADKSSFCELEFAVKKHQDVQVSTNKACAPPLTLLTLRLQSLPNARNHQNEIVAFAIVKNSRFFIDKPARKSQIFDNYYTGVTRSSDCALPANFAQHLSSATGRRVNASIAANERALLNLLISRISNADADIVVGHDIADFELGLLLQRVRQYNLPIWSRLGRLKRHQQPLPRQAGRRQMLLCGRVLCDAKFSANELVTKTRSYDLTELSKQLLKKDRVEYDAEAVRAAYASSVQLEKLLTAVLTDAGLVLRLACELNVLPLALHISNICGSTLNRTLLGGRSERNEMLLLHAFNERNFIPPDRDRSSRKATAKRDMQEGDSDEEMGGGTADNSDKKDKKGRRTNKSAYTGGLVLEPKKGFYDHYILLMDFASLYPSIIQEYNICFTTVQFRGSIDCDEDALLNSLELPAAGSEPGILPSEIRKLVESRREVKRLLRTPRLSADEKMQYDIRQRALKLTANSMYGCLGFGFSRFYAKHLAALITSKGREILMRTRELVEQQLRLEVIYGDTDSLMICTHLSDLDKVLETGQKVRSEVNRLYKHLEIEIDGVFKCMLLLKKKKYAALVVERDPGDSTIVRYKQELKGLDMVRRDWCPLARETSEYFIGQLFSGDSRDNILFNLHSKLQEIAHDMNQNKISIEKFVISKQLQKHPEEYPEKQPQPHVRVALRLNSRPDATRKLRSGDTVFYVVCTDGTSNAAVQRAYHPDELRRNESCNLAIDAHYYLAQQLHPVIARLCEPLEGTDAAQLAECLGLDPGPFRRRAAAVNQSDRIGLSTLDADVGLLVDDRYLDCTPFKFPCPTCKATISIKQLFTYQAESKSWSFNFASCPQDGCKKQLYLLESDNEDSKSLADSTEWFRIYLKNQLLLQLREFASKYYQGWLLCEDTTCCYRTNRISHSVTSRGQILCPACRKAHIWPEYSDSMLYDQLRYFESIFDADRIRRRFEATISSKLLINEKLKPAGKEFVRSDANKQLSLLCQPLKALVGEWIARNSYGMVNLGHIFSRLSANVTR